MKPKDGFEYRQTPLGGFEPIPVDSSEHEPTGPLVAEVLSRGEFETETDRVITARKFNGSVHWDLIVTINKASGERRQDIGEFSPCDCPKVNY